MGIERLSLDLPADTAPGDVQDTAADQLRARGIRNWSELSLQTILTTEDPGISRYTLTYWVDDNPTH